MKKIIAFDVDGTLTPSKQEINTEMSNLLLELVAVKKVVFISGGSMTQFHKQLGSFLDKIQKNENINNLFLLPTSGSKIFHYSKSTEDWELLSEIKFKEELKPKVRDAFDVILDEKNKYAIPSDHQGEYLEDRGTQMTFSALGQDAPNEPKAKWDPDQTKRKKIREVLIKILGDEVEIGIAGTTSVDILPRNTNKATGLIHLLKYLDLEKNDMLFIGDAVFPGGNDYSPMEAGIDTHKVNGPEETADFVLQLVNGA